LITCPGDFEVGAVDTEGDLALLANCAVIGALWVHDTSLTHLDGLSSLASVLGRLAIQSNDALTNVDGLSSLTSVGGGCTSTETKTYSTSTVCRASLQWEGA
jgi:hypothetical protein